jgi:phosphoribosylamine--glycine ligase/phosphoribosylaminoimidazole synthetase
MAAATNTQDIRLKDVLVVGKGCRESAMCHALLNDPNYPDLRVHTINHPNLPTLLHPLTDGQRSRLLDHHRISDLSDIVELCKRERIGLVIPGPEAPLVEGLADELRAADIRCYGPTRACARLESSKSFAKEMLRKHGVAVPDAVEFLPERFGLLVLAAHERSKNMDFVLKANGLAGGKGVIVPASFEEAQAGITALRKHIEHRVGDDCKILLEEKCYGEECSLIGFCDGKRIVFGPQAQDYKRLEDGDRGPNTGGMGAVCPVSVLSNREMQELTRKLTAMVAEMEYTGFLYVALMRSEPGGGVPLVIELNCRLGDPEAQVLLPALSNGFLSVVMGDKHPVWNPAERHMAVVVASPEYCRPEAEGLAVTYDIGQWSYLRKQSGIVVHPGKSSGRMLTIVASDRNPGASWAALRTRLYRTLTHPLASTHDKLPFYRRDIGLRHAVEESRGLRQSRGWTKPLRIAAMCSGNGTSLRLLLDRMSQMNVPPATVEVVVSNRASGTVHSLTRQRGIPTVYIHKREEERLIAVLRAFEVDAVFLIGYDAIVGPKLIAEYSDKLINVHPSLLPRHAGKFDGGVHQAVIDNGDLHTGCTFHVVTADVDRGPILLQRQIQVPRGTSAEKLKAIVQEEEGIGLADVAEMLSAGKLEYSVDGVGAEAVAIHAAKVDIEGFCGTWTDPLSGQLWGACTDGVGTKLTLALREYYRDECRPVSALHNIAQDLVAMSVNDLMVCGGRPAFFLDYIALDRSDPELCQGIIDGVRRACELVGCELIGGETAEMKGVYWPHECDLAGFAAGPISRQLPEPDQMQVGQPVYALPSSGVHSNGFTLIHSLLQKGASLDVDALLEPTRVYSDLPDILEYSEILGAAHITGGGVHANVQRILPSHLRLKLDNTAWEWPPIFRDIQRSSGLSDDEMLKVFNCGLGVLVVAEREMGKRWCNGYGLINVGMLIGNPSIE